MVDDQTKQDGGDKKSVDSSEVLEKKVAGERIGEGKSAKEMVKKIETGQVRSQPPVASGAEEVGSVGMKKVRKELVVPDEPVKRYSEPSREELKTKIDEQEAIIKEAIAKLDSTRGFFDERAKIRENGREEFQNAKKALSDLSEQLRSKFDQKKSLSAQINELRDNAPGRGTKNARSEDLPAALRGCKTAEDVDAKIRELEYRQATASLPIAQEKNLIADIAYLKHKGRSFIEDREKTVSAEKMARNQRIARRKELEEIRKAEDKEIDELKAKTAKQREVVDGIRRKQDKEIEALAAKFSDVDRDAERKTISNARKEIKKVREEYLSELDKWRMNERIFREQQRIAKRKKWEAAQAEREERRRAWEAEMAKYPKPHPYQKEKDMCTNLINYLQGLIGTEQEKEQKILAPEKTNLPSLGKSLPAREIATSANIGKVIGKSGAKTEDADQTFGGFVKKGGGKKGRKKGRRVEEAHTEVSKKQPEAAQGDKSTMSLPSHSMERFSAFTQLEISPPTKRNEVPFAIDALKAKLAYYDSAPPPEDSKKEKPDTESSKTTKEKKGKVKEYDGRLTQSEYPSMNGGADGGTGSEIHNGDGDVDGTDSSVDKRPSFVDVMAGKAKAPSATSNATYSEQGDQSAVASETSELQPTDVIPDAEESKLPSMEDSAASIHEPRSLTGKATAAAIVKGEAPTTATAIAQK